MQRWELSLPGEQELSWTITTDIRKPGIDTVAVIAMLSDDYREYRIDTRRHGRFPGTFNAHDWQVLESGKGIIRVGAGNNLPDVIFQGSRSSGEYSNSVENTDVLHAARVLKCQSRGIAGDAGNIFSVGLRLEENR